MQPDQPQSKDQVTDYDRFTAFAQRFMQEHPQADVSGEYYDLPAIIVYHQATHALPEGGWVEVNTITPATPPEFAWETEITINDKANDSFIHLILQRDRTVAETYGKTVLEVDDNRATEILEVLAQLTTA